MMIHCNSFLAKNTWGNPLKKLLKNKLVKLIGVSDFKLNQYTV